MKNLGWPVAEGEGEGEGEGEDCASATTFGAGDGDIVLTDGSIEVDVDNTLECPTGDTFLVVVVTEGDYTLADDSATISVAQGVFVQPCQFSIFVDLVTGSDCAPPAPCLGVGFVCSDPPPTDIAAQVVDDTGSASNGICLTLDF